MAETNKIVDAVDYIKRTNNISSTHEATAKLRRLLYASLWCLTLVHDKLDNLYNVANNLNTHNVCMINTGIREVSIHSKLGIQNLLYSTMAKVF